MKLNLAAIMFDLGGVLVEWDGVLPLCRMAQDRLSPEQARRYWLESPWTIKFETGQCSADEFAAGVVAELELPVTPEVFLAEFEAWDRGPLPGAVALLESLQPSYPLYCLSNNNTLHWRKPQLRPVLGFFKQCCVSFEMGLMKPDLAAFRYVADRMPERPGQTLFLDDNPECVAGAAAAGFCARQAKGVPDVRKVLAELIGP